MRRILGVLAALAIVGTILLPQVAQAQVEPFIGQLILVPYNFCPQGWLAPEGQLLPINQYTALFSLIGTLYGGDGERTFALPDLRGRVPVGVGQGPGLSPYTWGQEGGKESQTLTQAQMPAHSHSLNSTSGLATSLAPTGNTVLAAQDRVKVYSTAAPNGSMAPSSIGVAGGNQPFDIRPPFLGLQWCIAIQGVFPSRN